MLTRSWLLILIVFLTGVLFAQQSSENIEATLQFSIAHSRPDSTIARLYYEHGNSLSVRDPNRAIQQFQKALEIYEKQKNYLQLMTITSRIGQVYLQLDLQRFAMDYFTKAFEYSTKIKDNENISYLYSDIANVYYALGQFDIAEPYYRNGLRITKKLKDDFGSAVMLNNIALCKASKGDPDSALVYFNQALDIRKTLKDKFLILHSKQYIASLYHFIGDLDKAENIFLQIISEVENNPGLRDEAHQLKSISEQAMRHISRSRNRQEEADYWLEQSIQTATKINDIYTMSSYLMQKAFQKYTQSAYEEAVQIATDVYNKSKQLGILDFIRSSSGLLVRGYNKLNDPANSIKYFEEFSLYSDSLLQIRSSESLTQLHTAIQNHVKDIENRALKSRQRTIIIFSSSILVLMVVIIILGLNSIRAKRKNIERLKQFANASYEGLIVHDQGVTLEVNDQICNMLGYTRAELNGAQTLKFVPEKFHESVKQAIASKTLQNYEIQILKKDGAVIDAELMSRPYNYMGKDVRVAAIRDITERKQIIRTLMESETQLRQLNATKNRLFSIIARDLKNPFNAIIGFSDLIRKSKTTFRAEELFEMNDMIYEASRQAHLLLEDLLQWARIQTGNMRFAPEVLPLKKIISDEQSILYSSLFSKKLTLEIDCPDNAEVLADPFMISTIIRNAISNAIKFSQTGGTIQVSVVQTPKLVCIRVKDHGVGITPERLDQLFKIDQIESTQGTQAETGSGLGLIICKEMMDMHNGIVVVESELGKGSTFKFTFPVIPNPDWESSNTGSRTDNEKENKRTD